MVDTKPEEVPKKLNIFIEDRKHFLQQLKFAYKSYFLLFTWKPQMLKIFQTQLSIDPGNSPI